MRPRLREVNDLAARSDVPCLGRHFASASRRAVASGKQDVRSRCPCSDELFCHFNVPNSHNPLSAYSPSTAPEPQLTNSRDLNQMIRDGKLYLSLKRRYPACLGKQSRYRHRSL